MGLEAVMYPDLFVDSGTIYIICLLTSFLAYFSVLSQENGWEERVQNDLFCVGLDVKT